MKIEIIKKIDRHLGLIACSLLSIHYKLCKRFRSAANTHPKKILFIKYFGVGSITLSMPLIATIKKEFPSAKIYFLTFSDNKNIIELFNVADEIIYADLSPMPKFITSNMKALLYLRKQKIDIIFDLEFFSRFTSVMTYLINAKQRIEFYSEILWRGGLYTKGIKFNPYFHVKDNFLRLAQAIGIQAKNPPQPTISIPEEVQSNIQNLLKAHNVRENDIKICVNVNAGELAAERRWPPEYFVRLLDKLIKHNVKCILIGAKRDTQYVNNIASQINSPNLIDLSGKIDLFELAALFSQSNLLITNDSGPLHLANAIGTPIVAFFGPETPTLYGPHTENSVVFYKNIICSPCLNVLNAKTVCCDNKNQCMRDIDPDEVYRIITEKYHYLFTKESL